MPKLDPDYIQTIFDKLGLGTVTESEVIQSLWSGYGEIIRYSLTGGTAPSVIVKFVDVPKSVEHPRGWNSQTSHQRKMHSYLVESRWYDHWAKQNHSQGIEHTPTAKPLTCRIPKVRHVESSDTTFLFVLEDLDASGFPRRIKEASIEDMQTCLRWLADFHALFLGESPTKNTHSALWETGTYWHLATRQGELNALTNETLRKNAHAIDQRLNACQYQTIIHGDAKIANFCFSQDANHVAAVDFQYIGGGCGIKDVALFISSCLDSDDCFRYEDILLNFYFDALCASIDTLGLDINIQALEKEWRSLYAFAWADFVRFLEGWSPGHWKVHKYSLAMTQAALDALNTLE